MPEAYLHGVEIVEVDSGPRPIQAVRSSVIGLIGTAPDADAAAFPLNTPILIAGSRVEAAKLDTVGAKEGTLPQAIDDIFDQGVGALIVVVRVEEEASEAATVTNIIGGIQTDGSYTGVHAFLGAQSAVHVTPRIFVAPGFTGYVTRDAGTGAITGAPVVAELVAIADRLRGVILADGPNTTDAEAITYRELFGSKRVFVVDPSVKVWDTTANAAAVLPASARVAGIMAKSDNERGYWWSPSNREMLGIVGTARPVDFALGDPNSRANLLNENEVATIIHHDGYRLWGNRTCSADPKFAFLSVVRTFDMACEALLVSHLWAVDRNITRSYIEEVTEGVNAWVRDQVKKGALLGGRVYADPDLNTPEAIADGRAYWDIALTPPAPAERVTFRVALVNDYMTEVLAG